jgi:hypothetical protein
MGIENESRANNREVLRATKKRVLTNKADNMLADQIEKNTFAWAIAFLANFNIQKTDNKKN